jgi:hypothetical protein
MERDLGKERLMKKQQRLTEEKSPLTVRRETLRRLDGSELKEAVGGGRLRVPGGFYDDTTPILDDTTDP